MKRDKFLIPYSHDHHHGLVMAAMLRKGAPVIEGKPAAINEKADAIIKFYYSDLLPHFESEEMILFPKINEIEEFKAHNHFVHQLISELIKEHRDIADIINQISAGKYDDELLDKLGELLQTHIRKEERELFPLLEGKIDPEG